MTKKRKVCSPSQEGFSDIWAELKEFIVSENAKCVKEIKDSKIGVWEPWRSLYLSH